MRKQEVLKNSFTKFFFYKISYIFNEYRRYKHSKIVHFSLTFNIMLCWKMFSMCELKF